MNANDSVVSVVLVLDSDLARLRATVRVLTAHGYATASAASNADVVHHLNEGLRPTVILCESGSSRVVDCDLADIVHPVSPGTTIVVLEPPFDFDALFSRVRVLLDAPTLLVSREDRFNAFQSLLPESGITAWVITGLLVFAATLLASYVITRPPRNPAVPMFEPIEDIAPTRANHRRASVPHWSLRTRRTVNLTLGAQNGPREGSLPQWQLSDRPRS